jgi:RNA polymerase sigma-B factor
MTHTAIDSITSSLANQRPGGSTPTLTLVVAEPAASSAGDAFTRGQGQRSERAHRLAEETERRFREAAVADPERRRQLLDEIVTDHLWLAEALARRFYQRGEDEQDLLQVARAGLVEATQRFDPDRGGFLSFVVPTVLGVLKRHFRDQSWYVRPPRRTQELAFEIRRSWPALVQNLAAMPTDADLAADLGASLADIREARYASQGYHSTLLDSSTDPHGHLVPTRAEAEIEARLLLASIWSELDVRERELIRLRFYEELSQVQIAEILGTSQMQVSRYLNRLLERLRSMLGEEDSALFAS